MAINKKLYRSTGDKIIFGVCGGLGEYFDIDPVIVRIIFVLLTVWGGSGILIYVILAIVVPENSSANTGSKKKNKEKEIEENVEKLAKDVENVAKKHSGKGEMIFGLILLFVGLSLLAGNFFPIFNVWRLWPVILIIFAITLLVKGGKEEQ